MSSFTESIGHIHFPNRLRSSQDIYIILQPTASRGGLTFTEALIAPSPEAHLAPPFGSSPRSETMHGTCTCHCRHDPRSDRRHDLHRMPFSTCPGPTVRPVARFT
ncbi:hypothetical protein MHU86_18447 [Fragilaria crotonensis]|nr:hypothetical protein MHU86_18447 [Fragilaria crotonensis]